MISLKIIELNCFVVVFLMIQLNLYINTTDHNLFPWNFKANIYKIRYLIYQNRMKQV
jgi:hypothetical protein